jgi:hypothetical protein
MPFFVLCAGRSGSTLVRFLLDSHPVSLAPRRRSCLPCLCGLLASAWPVVEDVSLTAPGSARETSPAGTTTVDRLRLIA